MKLEFELTCDDLIAYNFFFMDNNPTIQRQKRIYTLTFGLGLPFLTALILYAYWRDIVATLIFAALFAIPSLFVAPRLWKGEARKSIRRLAKTTGLGPEGPYCVSLREDGLHEKTPLGESLCAWPSIHRIDENLDYAFVFVGPVQAAILPKRIGEEKVSAFVEEVRRRMEQR